MLKRIVAALTTAVLAVGLALGAALPASAHTPVVTPSCAGLDVSLTQYGGGNNYVTVTIDGVKQEDRTHFRYDFRDSYSWSPASSHTYKIEIDAADQGWDRLGGNAITGTFGPCTTTTECLNPMSQLQGFTILTEGDFTSDKSGAHVEGTLAVGGDLIVKTLYTTQGNHDGSPLPVVDGRSTGLLTGGSVTLNASGEAFRVMQGATRVGSVGGSAVTDASRFYPQGTSGSWLMMSSSASLSDVTATGLFASTFSGAFAALRSQADTIAAYTGTNVQFVTMSNSPNGGKQVTLTAGVTNVLRVSGSTLSSAGQLWFAGGVTPSANTPFMIDVTDTGSYNVTAPTLRNIDEEFVLWNFAKATSLGLSTSEFVKGSILAPRAALSVNSGGIEGQIAAASVVIRSVGEIHHIAYKPCAPTETPVTVSTAPSATPPTCTVDGRLVIPTQTGVVFSGAANGSGPGTYTVTAAAAPGYKLTGTSSWTITVLGTKDAANCTLATEPTLTVAQCDATSGALVSAFVTIPSNTNLQYSKGGTIYTPGQKVDVAAGSHVFTVVAINGYTNTGPSSFTVNVSAFDCNEAVKPALTLAQCDVASDTVTSAYVTIPTTTPGLEYRIDGIGGGAALTGDVQLAAGTYTVTVTAKAGYQNTGPGSFTIVVPALDCEKAVEPALTVAYCHPTSGLFQSAVLTFTTTTPGLEYRIAGQNGDQPLSGSINLPAGTYTVAVTEKPGVTNTGASSFTIVVPALTCEKAVEPTLVLAQCDATSGAFTPAVLTIPSTTPGLEYRIAGIQGGNPLSGDVELPAGDYTVTVTAKTGVTNTGPASFPISVAALECEKAVEPTLVVAQCDVDGNVLGASLTATTTTPGLTYTIRGGAVLQPGVATILAAGTYTVDVTTATGVTNTGASSFTITIDALDCNKAVEPKLTVAVCDALTGPVSAYLTIPTTTPGLIYSIGGTDYAAGATVNLPTGPYTVEVRAAAGYSNTGPASFSGSVAPVDCEGERYVAPTVTSQTCDTDNGGTTDGALLFTLDADLTYFLDGTEVTVAQQSNLKPGDYQVKVVPEAGHYLVGGVDTFTVNIPAAVGCDNVYTTPLDPFAAPEICDPQSTNKLDGSITVVHVAGVQWYIGKKSDGSDKVAVGDPTTVGNVTYPYAGGNYFVFAESKDPTITIKPGHTVFPLTVDFPSQLCTLGYFTPSATAESAVCNATGDDRGTITVDLMDGVTYAFQGGAVITSAQTKVAPGTYTVVATPDDPRSSLSQDTWVLTVTAPAVILCDLTTLALTGATPSGFVILAIVLLQAGLVLLAVRYIRTRKARHLAI